VSVANQRTLENDVPRQASAGSIVKRAESTFMPRITAFAETTGLVSLLT